MHRKSISLRSGVTRLLLVAMVIGVLLPVTPARSHAIIIDSNPPDGAMLPVAPQRLVLRFNVSVERSLMRITLRDEGGRSTPLRAAIAQAVALGSNQVVVPLPRLDPGAYTVYYKVLATDGHVTESVVRFTIRGADSRR